MSHSAAAIESLCTRGIVLDRDIFSIDPFELHDTKVMATYLDGREVYAAKSK